MTILNCVKYPFPGYCEFSIEEDQMIHFNHIDIDSLITKPMTKEQFITAYGDKYKFVSSLELDVLFEAHYQYKKTKTSKITFEIFDRMLNILPPSRWTKYGDIEYFHTSEIICGNIVNWYFKYGKNYYTFIDDSSLSLDILFNKIRTIHF